MEQNQTIHIHPDLYFIKKTTAPPKKSNLSSFVIAEARKFAFL